MRHLVARMSPRGRFAVPTTHLALVYALMCAQGCIGGQEAVMQMRMPAFRPAQDAEDVYLCTSFLMPSDKHSLTHIAPHAKQEEVHHMLLFGCEEPQKEPGEVWMCHGHGICKGPSQTLYGWGKDAPALTLPPDSGFAVGPGTQIPRIVVQVHYLAARPEGDASGVDVTIVPRVQPSTVSLIVFAPAFRIPAHTAATDVTAECCFEGFQPLRGVAFRVHTHDLGVSVALDVSPLPFDSALAPALTERFAERDPQLPQMFQPLGTPPPIILPGHFLRSTCRFNSTTRDQVTYSGWSHDDEMCNMYWMAYSQQPHFASCGSRVQDKRISDKMPDAVAVPLPLPVVKSGAGALPSLGPISGVAVSPLDDTIWLLVRHGTYWTKDSFTLDNRVRDRKLIAEDTVYQVHPTTGALLSSWGANLFSIPHGISIDWQGRIWITDVGRHQVFQFEADSTLLLTLGTAFTPGNTSTTFCKPTDVAPQPDGGVHISDGYCNSRMLPGAPQGGVNGVIMHAVSVNGCRGQAVVADRNSGVVHIVNLADQTSAWVAVADAFGFDGSVTVWAVRTGPRGDTYMLMQEGWDWAHGSLWMGCIPAEGPPYRVQLEGVTYPHDFAFATLPAEYVTTAVPVVVFVTETPSADMLQPARLHRFVLAQDGWSRAPAAGSPAVAPTPAKAQPPPSDAAGTHDLQKQMTTGSHVRLDVQAARLPNRAWNVTTSATVLEGIVAAALVSGAAFMLYIRSRHSAYGPVLQTSEH